MMAVDEGKVSFFRNVLSERLPCPSGWPYSHAQTGTFREFHELKNWSHGVGRGRVARGRD